MDIKKRLQSEILRPSVELSRSDELLIILKQAKTLALRYRELTGRSLNIGGDIAIAEAMYLLHLTSAPLHTAGYEVVRTTAHGSERLRVKSRVMASPKVIGGVMGSFDLVEEWDGVLLVLMDKTFDTVSIFEASRRSIVEALCQPRLDARKQRGTLSAALFCETVSHKVWPV